MNPNDPVVIGNTKEGLPIWFQPKDLIPTPDEELERWDKTLDSRQKAMIDKAARMVLLNATIFLEETILATAYKSFVQTYQKGSAIEVRKYLENAGYEAIQDGLKTVIKYKGRILREMNADISIQWAGYVARRVNELVKSKQSPI